MRVYVVRRAASVAGDLAAIRRHLIRSYVGFGETCDAAADRADARLREAFDFMRSFATPPYRGTVHPDLKGGVRHITERNSVFYFEIDEPKAEVRILTVFFSGADHLRQIVERLRR